MYKDPLIGFIAIGVAVIYFFSLMTFEGLFIGNTPTKADIARGCARHGGVASISNANNFDRAVITCKDGKFWFGG